MHFLNLKKQEKNILNHTPVFHTLRMARINIKTSQHKIYLGLDHIL